MGRLTASKRLECGGLETETWKFASGGCERRMVAMSKVSVGVKFDSSTMGACACRHGPDRKTNRAVSLSKRSMA